MVSMASRAAAAFRTAAAAAQGYRRQAAASWSVSRSLSAATATARRRGEYVPVYVALGLIALSASLGLGTARQQLAHAPNVRVDKKKRARTVPEVAAPDLALDEAERFVGRSLFRKVAHVQGQGGRGLADPVAEYSAGRKAVTLKDVGVDAPGIQQGREGILDRVFKKNSA